MGSTRAGASGGEFWSATPELDREPKVAGAETMSWRDRLAQRDRTVRANANSAKSAVSPPFGTIGNAGLSKKRAAKRAVRKMDDDAHGYFVESAPNWRAIDGVVSTRGSMNAILLPIVAGGPTARINVALVEYGAGIPRAWAEGF